MVDDSTIAVAALIIVATMFLSSSSISGAASSVGQFGATIVSGSGEIDINITQQLSITLIDATVDFGAGFVKSGFENATLDSNSTSPAGWNSTVPGSDGWPNSKDLMTIENNGNVAADLNISASKNASGFIGGSSPKQEYFAENNESAACSGTLQSNYTDLLTSETNVCTSLKSSDPSDALNIYFKITIPTDAAEGTKGNTITFSAVQA